MKKRYPYGTGTVKWVSTGWLAEHLGDVRLTILDVQPNVHDYISEHIPGAVYMNEGLLRVPKGGMPAKYAPPKSIQAVFGRLGLWPSVPVVVYTGTGAFKKWGDGLEQTMAAYTLARFGHDNVLVLDGGLDKWKKERRALTKKFPSVRTSNFPVKVRRSYFVEYGQFKRIKDKRSTILLDARPAAVYAGQGPWMKPGHIPGAVNLPWADLMDDTNKRLLKPEPWIREKLGTMKITPDNLVICSCGTGREATNEFILFKWYLGYPKVKIYEGSFTEWSSYPRNRTVTGKRPR